MQGFCDLVTSLAVRVRAFVYSPGQRVARLRPQPKSKFTAHSRPPHQCSFSNTSCTSRCEVLHVNLLLPFVICASHIHAEVPRRSWLR